MQKLNQLEIAAVFGSKSNHNKKIMSPLHDLFTPYPDPNEIANWICKLFSNDNNGICRKPSKTPSLGRSHHYPNVHPIGPMIHNKY